MAIWDCLGLKESSYIRIHPVSCILVPWDLRRQRHTYNSGIASHCPSERTNRTLAAPPAVETGSLQVRLLETSNKSAGGLMISIKQHKSYHRYQNMPKPTGFICLEMVIHPFWSVECLPMVPHDPTAIQLTSMNFLARNFNNWAQHGPCASTTSTNEHNFFPLNRWRATCVFCSVKFQPS